MLGLAAGVVQSRPHKNQAEEHSEEQDSVRRENTGRTAPGSRDRAGLGQACERTQGHTAPSARAHGPGTLMPLKGLVLARKPRG